MIPGPYSLCHVTGSEDDPESNHYRTLRFGYDKAADAYAARSKVASENEIPEDEVWVIRLIEPEEAHLYTS